MSEQNTSLTCDPTAFTPEQRGRYEAVSSRHRQATEAVVELPDGYAFRYRAGEDTWMTAAAYADLERRCCPFLAFALRREPEDGAGGREGGPGCTNP